MAEIETSTDIFIDENSVKTQEELLIDSISWIEKIFAEEIIPVIKEKTNSDSGQMIIENVIFSILYILSLFNLQCLKKYPNLFFFSEFQEKVGKRLSARLLERFNPK